MSLRAGFPVAAWLLAGLCWSEPAHAQDAGMAWIEAARNAPVTGAPAVPVPERRPRPPVRKAAVQAPAAPDAAQPSRKPVESAASDPATTGSISRTGVARTTAPPPVRRPPAPERAAAPAPPTASAPARKMPPLKTAQKKRRGAGSSQEARKCEALGRCRDAFAKCKAKFVKEHGKWDLEKQTCGADYKVCIRKTFAPGEMFFTRWFWPYEECP